MAGIDYLKIVNLAAFVHLVDPASSHMLVSKIKPCMFQNKLFIANLQMAH